MDYAAAVNEEISDLFAAGADIVQIDEPYMQARPEKAREYGLEALNRALDGVDGHDRRAHLLRLRRDHPRAARRATRSCPSSPAAACDQISIETAQSNLDCVGARELPGQDDHPRRASTSTTTRSRRPRPSPARIRRALPYVAPESVIVAPDCGMKYLPRDVAFGKMRAMVAGAKLLRAG